MDPRGTKSRSSILGCALGQVKHSLGLRSYIRVTWADTHCQRPSRSCQSSV
jgi:hypothetical protein